MVKRQKVQRKYFNQKEAAEYCGYCVKTFREYIISYDIPKSGPKKDRFSQVVLDEFMASPENYFNPLRYRRGYRVPVEI